ncbi:unnamed protein product, partial [Mesorhabditis belari]|uniref:Amino acid transporter transmembrane domain-containing protein n=1 Tax=Mesorhabditis belari TaxID=2138241 RepID=A0AAF3EIG8_9BILA
MTGKRTSVVGLTGVETPGAMYPNEKRSSSISKADFEDPRKGDTIGVLNAAQCLSKAMVNAGAFSLPYAWYLGGFWVSFVASFVICALNWYGNHILVRASQHLAKKSNKPALDYGHFCRKLCDNSDSEFLRKVATPMVIGVNISVLCYQLGLGSVAILFIADNMVSIVGTALGPTRATQMLVANTIVLVFAICTNMYSKMRVVAFFAMISTFFLLIGIIVIMQESLRQPDFGKNLGTLPAVGNSFSDMMQMIGILMYAYEGQAMILPIENKLEKPEQMLAFPFGVVPITMLVAGFFIWIIGLVGYAGYGSAVEATITINMPQTLLYQGVNVCLMIQTLAGNAIALYVIFEMFLDDFVAWFRGNWQSVPEFIVDKGFRLFWVLLCYAMAVVIPHLDIMIPLVGVTGGTMCALIYPPLFEMMTFWNEWKATKSTFEVSLRVFWNLILMTIGVYAIITGVYSNYVAVIAAFEAD